jgi:hypothetical protein
MGIKTCDSGAVAATEIHRKNTAKMQFSSTPPEGSARLANLLLQRPQSEPTNGFRQWHKSHCLRSLPLYFAT